MTLRLRLTLFYTLLVALVLIASGLLLHVLLQRSLQSSFDQSLKESSQIILSTLKSEHDEGYSQNIEIEIELDTSRFPDAQSVLILNRNGQILTSFGGGILNKEDFTQNLKLGFSTKDTWRILTEPFQNFIVVVAKDLQSIQSTVSQFDRLFLILLPIAICFAFGLGYLLAQQVLKPVDRLTRAAYDLASRRAWREKLPEPKTKDELWRLSSATNNLLAALKEVIESERRFTADAAHELRTPLTVLQGRLEQALEQASETEDSKNRSRLLKAHAASEQLLSLVEKLLLLARTEAGQGLNKEKLALDEIAFHTAEDIRSLFDEKGLGLELTLPDSPIYISGDQTAISLLIRNLLENALKFTATGKVQLEVSQQTERALITITDDGEGIPEEALTKLFNRFYQSDVKHRQMGSGLGLALVKSIADWHGGTIQVSNKKSLDTGAVFTIELPTV